MSVNKINIKSRTNFAAIPNDFAQNSNLSLEAKGLALFFQSLPDDWIIHPLWVQEQLNIGDWTWRKTSKELKKHGCLKLHRGGNGRGSYYTFDLWKTQDNLQKPETLKTNGSAETLEYRESKNQRPYKETRSNKETADHINNKQGDDPVVVSLIESLRKIKIDYNNSVSLINEYGYDLVLARLKHVMGDNKIKIKAAWLIKSLKQNYEIQPETQAECRREAKDINQQIEKMMETRSADEVGKEWIKKMRGKK